MTASNTGLSELIGRRAGLQASFASDRGLENLERIVPAAKETSLCRLPVDDLPDVLNIGCFAIEVLFPLAHVRSHQ